MRAWSLVVLALLGNAAEVPAQPPVEPHFEGPPERIESRAADRSQPVWVSAERAFRQDGALDEELFTPFERSQIQRMAHVYREGRKDGRLGSGSDPCAGARGIDADYYVLDPGIEELVKYSRVVFSGTVLGRGEGLYRSQPVSLYRVSVDKVWKVGEDLSPGDFVHVAFPDAQIRMGDDWLCMRSPRFPDKPCPGKKILVFSHRGSDGTEPIFYPMEVELFFEIKSSTSVPRHLTSVLSSPNFVDIEAEVSKVASASRERP